MNKAIKVLLLTGLLVALLILAKSFLIPLTFAAIIAMLMLPVAAWLQKKGWPHWLAALAAVLLFLLALSVLISVLSWQISILVDDSGNIEQQAVKKVKEFQQYLQQTFGLSVKEQNKIADKQSDSASESYIAGAVGKVLAGVGGFVTDLVLFMVYLFLLILYRRHLKEFVLRMFFPKTRAHASEVMKECRQVSQQYITGLALMIVILSVMYSIGFSIVGVKNAILFAMLASVLETVPFIGNLTGSLLAVMMVVVQGGSNLMIMGVVIAYAAVQFIQSYLIQPLVVGKKVDINPLVTIAGLVLAELIWGIPGMVLAIPVMGIAKIIFDNVEQLHPLGFLMGEVETGKKDKKDKEDKKQPEEHHSST